RPAGRTGDREDGRGSGAVSLPAGVRGSSNRGALEVARLLAGALLACALSGCVGRSHRAVPTAGLELEGRAQIRTPPVAIETNASRAEALRMARQLSSFTDLMRSIMNLGRVEPALPMRVWVFARAKQFQRFPQPNAAGYAVPTLHGTLLVLSLEPSGFST